MSLKNDKRQGTDSDPAGLSMGFVMIPHYAQYFWRPYLGLAAFALWEMLLSFCYGSKDTAWPSVSRLSRMLTNSDNSRHVVRGRVRRDHGRERFVPGALQVLEREGLVRVQGADASRGARESHGATYIFRVRKSLPLLRPEQVSRLSPSLQRDHARFLARVKGSMKSPGALDTSADAWDTEPDDADKEPDTRDSSPDDADKGPDAWDGTNNNYQEHQRTIDDKWKDVVSELSLQLDPAVWDRLVKLTEAYVDAEEEVLTITCRDQYALDFLEHRYARFVQRAVKLVYGQELELRFEWTEEE
ncbi:MAG: hypothetical protein L6435_07805 [Anaerolineae bacterium]|nr:hypothetical protein [Anaerolineae bacterium]